MKILVDEEIWAKIKVRAAAEHIDLMTKDGWIVQAILEKLSRQSGSELEWIKTEEFKQLARKFCTDEGWITPQTVKLDNIAQLNLKGLVLNKDYIINGDKVCLMITGVKKLLEDKQVRK